MSNLIKSRFQLDVPVNVGLIVLDRKRLGFDVEWGKKMKVEITGTELFKGILFLSWMETCRFFHRILHPAFLVYVSSAFYGCLIFLPFQT